MISFPSFLSMEPTLYGPPDKAVQVAKPQSHGCVLSAHNISYRVKVSNLCFRAQIEKEILSDVTAVFKQGLTAVMGPTGSGKSTLLDILAGRKDTSCVSGLLLMDGQTLPSNFKCMVGYVVQDDTIMGTLTIRENLHFSAALRLPSSVTSKQRTENVDKVIKELGLVMCADTRVGTDFTRGVSGGERKRCNIGMELITSPAVLFLDEPTTGLDADTAFTVLTFLKRLSRKGRTIIFSIHQPRYTIYSLFDSLLLLVAGSVVYSGPAHEALDFFAAQGYQCEIHNNPPDFFLDVINNRKLGPSKGEKSIYYSLSQGARLAIRFRLSTWGKRLQEEADNIMCQFEKQSVDTGRQDQVKYATSFARQVVVVSERAVKSCIRGPQTIIITIVGSLVLSAIITAIFWQLSEDPVSGFKDRSGVMFFLIINQLFFNMPAVDVFIKERKIFMHENVSGFYRVSVYFIVKIVFDIIPLRTIPLVIMSCIVYFSTGLHPGSQNFLLFMLTLLCTTFAGAALCFLVSAMVHEFATAQIILALICILMMLFGGFLISFDSIGPWLHWAQHFSFFKYALSALYINEFKGREFCNVNRTYCETGNDFLMKQQIPYQEDWHFWQNHVALMAYTCGLLTLAYFQLRYMKKTP